MKNSFIYILCMFILFSCRKDEPIDGPLLNDLFGDFAILQEITPSTNSIDFPVDGSFFFTGELTKNTDWHIQFTGNTTGATRLITGSDRLISIDNSAWDGGANTFPGFGIEEVSIQITFPNEEDSPTLNYTVNITATKIDSGYLITDFESGTGPNWTFFNQTTVTGGIVCDDGESAKGVCHYSFNGTVGWDWAIGSVMIRPDEGTFDLPAGASNLFFNMGFKALENVGPSNSFILFWFDEDDNGDGVFDESSEDRWTYEYWSQDSEWDLITKEYADLQFDIEGNTVPTNGNGLPEPAKLVSINVFFLANPDNGNAKALVDQLIFTSNGPYRP